MIEQALLRSPEVLVDSPHSQSQDSDSQEKFIKNKQEILADLVFGGPPHFFHDAQSLAWDFAKSVKEYFDLTTTPLYYGEGLPRGDGAPVIYIGGFLTVPENYRDPVSVFRRSGLNAMTFPWGLNIGPVRETGRRLKEFVREQVKQSGRKAKLIGHSLGGFDELAFFMDNPEEFVDLVDHVVFDASPRPTRLNKALGLAYLLTQWFREENDFDLNEKTELLKKLEDLNLVKVTSVDSSHDPVIGGQFFGRAEDHFVIRNASHAGLGFHPDFLRIATFRFAGKELDTSNYPNISQLIKAA